MSDHENVVNPHPTDFHGHFIVSLSQLSAFNLAGIDTSPLESLVRFGVLPHNGCASQKMIQILGRRALDLLQRRDPARKAEQDSYWCHSLQEEAELFSLWRAIDVLSILKPLEKLADDSLTQKAELIEACLNKLNSLTQPKYANIIDKLPLAEKTLLDQLDQQQDQLRSKIVQLLRDYQNAITYSTCTTAFDHQQQQAQLWRTVLQHLEKQQTCISLLQFNPDSNTHTVQQAYYALQDHHYSLTAPSDAQLWIENREEKWNQLDTSRYPSLRQQDTLWVCALLNEGNPTTSSGKATALSSVETTRNRWHRAIKTQHIKLKSELDQTRLKHLTWRQPLAWLSAYLGCYRDATVHAALASQKLKAGETGWSLRAWLGRKPAENTMHQEIFKWLNEKNSNPKTATILPEEDPLPVYTPTDLSSAVNAFSYEFAQYFNRELAVKHPVLTTLAFVVPSIYLTTLSLEALNIAPHAAHLIYTTLSKILTANGHIVNAKLLDQLMIGFHNEIVAFVGSVPVPQQFIIMSFGAPKFTLFFTDVIAPIITGMQHNLSSDLQQLLSAGNLDVASARDVIRQILRNLVKEAPLILLALALGLSAPALKQSGPLLHLVGEIISAFDDIEAKSFSDLISKHGLEQAKAGINVVLQVKTAGLALAKIALIQHFATRHEHLSRVTKAIHFFENNETPQTHTDYRQHRRVLERALAAQPELKLLLGLENLNQWQIRDYCPPPKWLQQLYYFAKKIIGTVNTLAVGSLALLPSLLYIGLTPSNQTPQAAWARYCLKQSLKLIYGLLRGPIGLAVYSVKFFCLALSGCVRQATLITLRLLSHLIRIPLAIGERTKIRGVWHAIAFSGVLILPVIQLALRIVESVSYALSFALLPITAAVILIVSTMTKKTFKDIWQHYRHHHHPLSARCAKWQQDFYQEYPNGNRTQQFETAVFKLLVTLGLAYVEIKNGLGAVARFCRDNSLRRLDQRLQQVALANVYAEFREFEQATTGAAATSTNKTSVTASAPEHTIPTTLVSPPSYSASSPPPTKLSSKQTHRHSFSQESRSGLTTKNYTLTSHNSAGILFSPVKTSTPPAIQTSQTNNSTQAV